MSRVKPTIDTDAVQTLLQEHFGEPVTELEVVGGGNVAQTFSFKAGSQAYIVRFNPTMAVNFEKEAYIYDKFASSDIPMPNLVHIGLMNGVHYAISEKVEGRNLLEIPREEYLGLIPAQMEILDAIHRSDVRGTHGYGIFNGEGLAEFHNWKASLTNIAKEEDEADFYGNWYSLFSETFLEKELFDSLHARMVRLVEYLPEERYLVHGGYGLGNILAKEGKITAVLDWLNARFGDFLFDVAYLDFWSPDDGWRERFRQHYEQTAKATPNYEERILCYECYIALESFRFYAKDRDKQSYDWARARILSLLPEERP
jgi:hygromycin-B 4-O-kinase